MGVPAVDLTDAPKQLRELVEQAMREGEVVLTRGGEAVAKITPLRKARSPRRPSSARGLIHMAEDFDAADELRSLQETAHLLRSPRNAERLLRALGRALERSGKPQGVAELRREARLHD